MNIEDYSKYYIQGSDHYLIPKDVFNELFSEMENWREEAKELKEKLVVTQTNEETFRLEMEDITRILGLDEDTIFDDVKAYAKSLKYNMFEKEQLNSLVNSCQEEIRQLKKQLQERPKEYVFIGNAQNKTRDFINQITKDNKEFKNQQKEFTEYMNKTIEELECDDVEDEEMKVYLIQRIDIFKEILKKYNEKVTDINVGNIGDKGE